MDEHTEAPADQADEQAGPQASAIIIPFPTRRAAPAPAPELPVPTVPEMMESSAGLATALGNLHTSLASLRAATQRWRDATTRLSDSLKALAEAERA